MGVVLKERQSAVVFDDAAKGIVIATWFGEPSVDLVAQYYAAHGAYLDQLRKERGRFVMITDTFATVRPSPAARKRIVDGFAALGPDVSRLTLQNYIIVDNALIRGVVTAIGWLDSRLADVVAVKTPSQAIEAALSDLDKAGIPRPTNLSPSGYKRPQHPREGARVADR